MRSVSKECDFSDEDIHSDSTYFKLHPYCKATKWNFLESLSIPLILCRSDDNLGWKSYFVENPTSFRDLPLKWDGDGKIPDWLSGTYVKNGPAQVNNKIKSCKLNTYSVHFKALTLCFTKISFGSSRRIMTSWLDGYAKLHSFKLSGSNVLYSGRMLESPNYLARWISWRLYIMKSIVNL